jgi:hypothetical protein
MNGEGIMALPQDTAMPSGGGLGDFESLLTAQQVGRELGPAQTSKEVLSAGAEIDPFEVKQFLDEISAAGLTPDDKEAIREILRRVKANPGNYLQVRQELLNEGAPEDLLPEEFDPEFFIALELALEANPSQTAMAPEMPVQGFAEGGIVQLPEMQAVAAELAKMGRNGDTMLAHITPNEAAVLKRIGGSGTINPYTGMPEFFLKKLFKGVSKAVKSVGKAVKKFAKSTVGRIVIGIGAGMILGPAAVGFLQGAGFALSPAAIAGVTAATGTFASGLAAGDGLKNSLRSAALVGTTVYGGSALMGGSAAMATPTTATGPQSFTEGLSQGWNNAKSAVNSMLGTQTPTATPPTGATRAPTAAEAVGAPSATGFGPEGAPIPDVGFGPEGAPIPRVAPPSSQYNLIPPSQQNLTMMGTDAAVAGGQVGPQTAERGIFGKTYDFFSPSARSEAATREVIAKALKEYPNNPAAQELFIKANAPGAFTKYGPLVAGGLGITALAGGMKPQEGDPSPLGVRDMQNQYTRWEDIQGINVGPGSTYPYQVMVPTQGIGSLYQPQYQQAPRPMLYAKKGSGPDGVTNFPRKTGPINGPGTGTSDSIPAMLSDGEFVFTAKAVRNMGSGSRRKGAARMYKLMKMLEGGPVGSKKKG